MPDPPNPLAEFVERLRRERAALDAQDWTPPEPPDEPDGRDSYRLKPLTESRLPPMPKPISLEELRSRLLVRLHDYLAGPSESVLLVRTPPGSGKTHGAVGAAQLLAHQGKRGLWAAGRHNMFTDLAGLPHFEAPLWYHWHGLHREIEDEAACRYSSGQQRWGELGYDTMDLCQQLCGRLRDNWIERCPYRLQAKRKEPLVFAQHQHLVSGLAVGDFDFAIVDELPLKAFVEDRLIPVNGLEVGAVGPLADLTQILASLCRAAPERGRLAGRALFEEIGELLDDVYAQVEVNTAAEVLAPAVWSEGEVFRLPYLYVFDFLTVAVAEQRAWRAGWSEWNERLWVTQAGLHLLRRGKPWENLPAKVVVLDATAQPDLYHMLFQREVELFEREVSRRGRVYQVAGRLNGRDQTREGRRSSGAAPEGDALSDTGRELVEVAKRLARRGKRPGVVCWKSLAPHFRRAFGAENVLTFGALRGTNALQDCDVLIIAGTFQPDGSNMLDLAVALTDQLEPFYQLDDDGKRQPLYRHEDREYRLSEAGLAQAREQFGGQTMAVTRRVGYYANPTLDAIHRQLREAELLQALHRARIAARDAEVWLLTSTPIQEEPLDGLWDDPPIGPERIHWQVWLNRLEGWIEAQWQAGNSITYASLAEAAGVSLNWARRNRWLEAIVTFMPDKWQSGQIDPVGRGRPVSQAIPLRSTSLN